MTDASMDEQLTGGLGAQQARVLVTGAAGMLGSQVLLCAPDGVVVVGTDLKEAPGVDASGVDLADAKSVEVLFNEHGPFTGVVHCAAYTAVDDAESNEELALRVNATACEVLAQRCTLEGVDLLVVSTDFVFDGSASDPYREDDQTSPLGVYGRTKLAGEQAAMAAHPTGTRIVRTQWLYGPRGNHFPGTMLRLATERDELKVVQDQVGSPTSTLELAPALWDVLSAPLVGILHAACEGQASWYDVACATLEYAGVEGVQVEPCTSEAFPRPAPRPAYSVLNCGRLAALRGRPLAHWQDALKTYLGNEDQ
ncbi:MAG: dTDP-4-dehydrorhamnose reductase [Planctomycetota bacterium]|nr:dTDP-4-dehydrorhamnose reductase [Planctomycetota bacterium]